MPGYKIEEVLGVVFGDAYLPFEDFVDDLKGKKIGIKSGTNYYDLLNEDYKDLKSILLV